MSSSNTAISYASGWLRRHFPDRPVMQTIFQLTGTLAPRDGETVDTVWEEVRKTILGSLKRKAPCHLPQEAWEGDDFECSIPNNRIDGVSIPQDDRWCLRLTHPDMPFRDNPAVPGRAWTVETAFKKNPDDLAFAIRLFCTSQPYCTEPVAYSRPGFMRYFAKDYLLTVDRPLSSEPWIVQGKDDLDHLELLVGDEKRRLPVILLTEADTREFDVGVHKYLLDDRKLAGNLLGLAHVVCMPHATTFEWTKRVGKTWSAFQGAVRTYNPGLRFDADDPRTHPLAMPQRIMKHSHGDLNAEDAFAQFIIDKAYQDAANKPHSPAPCLYYPEAKRRKAKIALQEASEEADWKPIYEDQIKALNQQLEEVIAEYEQALDLQTLAEKERDRYIDENKSIQMQLDGLRYQLEERHGESADSGVTIPDNYDDLPDWTQKHLAGRLTLHPRAINGVKKARYQDVELVYRALLLLANEYRFMRLGYNDAREHFEQKLGVLGLRNDLSISEERAGEEGDTYYVQYPLHTSSKCFLKHHLCKCSTKNDKMCMRIYYFWDKESQQVVVGWLPSHLDIRMS